MADTNYLTTCKCATGVTGKPCGQQFRADPLQVPIIGELPDAKTMRFVQALGQHINRKHPEHGEQIGNLGIQFSGMLIALSYESEDPGLLKLREEIRYNTHQFTRRAVVTDDHIRDVVARLGFDAEGGAPIVAAMIELRDFLTETGRHMPEGVRPVAVATPVET